MRHSTSKLFTALTFTALVGGTLIGTTAAQAKEPDHYFYPAKPWNISTPAMQQVSTAPRCTIATEFNNGFIFGLSGSAKWLEGLSVDFRQPAFEAGRSYDATLSVPGGPSTQLSANASDASRIDISLRGQKDLYEAMSKSAVLDIDIENNLFRFYLVGFDTKNDAFESCMAAAGGGAPSPAQMQNASAMPEIENPLASADEPSITLSMSDDAVPLHPTINESIAFEESEVEFINNPPDTIEPQPVAVDPVDIETPDDDDLLSVAKAGVEQRARSGQAMRVTEMIEETIDQNPAYVSTDASAELPPAETLTDTPPQDVSASGETAAENDAQAVQDAIAAMRQKEQEQEKETKKNNAQHDQETAQLEAPEEILKNPDQFMPVPGRYTASQLAELSGNTKPEPKAVASEIEEVEIAVVEAEPPALEPVADQDETGNFADFTTMGDDSAMMTPEPEVEARTKTIATIPAYTETREQITAEADFTALDAVEPASASPDQEVVVDPMLLRKISELEERLAQTQKENAALNSELKAALQESRDEQLSIASENWNLEAATMKYHEAERQLKRMGQQLQKERAQCNVEKSELKNMLFDPQLTNQAQLARLAELEAELMRLRAQMGR